MTESNPAGAADSLTAQRLVLAALAAELRGDEQGMALLLADADAALLRVALVCACAGVARIAERQRGGAADPEDSLVEKVARRLLELECEPDE